MSIIGKWYGFGQNPSYDRGIRELSRAEYEAAAAEFRFSLTELSDPEMREAARNRLVESLVFDSEGRVREGKAGKAVELLAEAIKYRPRYADLRLRMAEALLLDGRAGDSRDEANIALEINNYFTRAMLVKAAGWAEEDVEAARTMIRLAEETEPNLPADELRRIRDHLDFGRHRAAAASLLELRVAGSWDAKSLAEIGLEMARQGRWEDAEQNLAAAVQLEPGWADLRCRHGEALLQCDRLAEAFDELTMALGINENYADAFAVRGVVRRRMGDDNEARVDFRRAIAINPNHTVAAQELSRLAY
jgi:tetratricopeptide (TPR) repeat protein